MDEPVKAPEWLECAARDGLPNDPLFASDRGLARIRHGPVFMAFLARQKQRWDEFRKL